MMVVPPEPPHLRHLGEGEWGALLAQHVPERLFGEKLRLTLVQGIDAHDEGVSALRLEIL
jgi:hypothetical protein